MSANFKSTAGGNGTVQADVLIVEGRDIIQEIDSITGVEGGKVNRTGDTMTGKLTMSNGQGISFGQQVAANPQDVSKHIDIWGGIWGINITSNTINFVADSGVQIDKFIFWADTTKMASIQTAITDDTCLTPKSYVDGRVADAANVTTGTFAVARIPTLPQSQITSLTTDLAAKLTATTAQFNAKLTASQGAAVADAAGANPTKAEFDALLASLRTAGIIAT